jgi:hypothetical protein
MDVKATEVCFELIYDDPVDTPAHAAKSCPVNAIGANGGNLDIVLAAMLRRHQDPQNSQDFCRKKERYMRSTPPIGSYSPIL